MSLQGGVESGDFATAQNQSRVPLTDYPVPYLGELLVKVRVDLIQSLTCPKQGLFDTGIVLLEQRNQFMTNPVSKRRSERLEESCLVVR